jgi:hypothetical protein
MSASDQLQHDVEARRRNLKYRSISERVEQKIRVEERLVDKTWSGVDRSHILIRVVNKGGEN